MFTLLLMNNTITTATAAQKLPTAASIYEMSFSLPLIFRSLARIYNRSGLRLSLSLPLVHLGRDTRHAYSIGDMKALLFPPTQPYHADTYTSMNFVLCFCLSMPHGALAQPGMGTFSS